MTIFIFALLIELVYILTNLGLRSANNIVNITLVLLLFLVTYIFFCVTFLGGQWSGGGFSYSHFPKWEKMRETFKTKVTSRESLSVYYYYFFVFLGILLKNFVLWKMSTIYSSEDNSAMQYDFNNY